MTKTSTTSSPVEVWVSYPLKQGLKHVTIYVTPHSVIVWVSYPLKQGLKQEAFLDFNLRRISLSQLSIKTRIETLWQGLLLPAEAGLSQLSIKTRIETYLEWAFHLVGPPVWVSYPLKQGLKHNWRRGRNRERVRVWVSYPLKQGLKQSDVLHSVDTSNRFESAIH